MEVSIITGAYNLESCFSFQKSMESILNQTHTDFEFIICDDGSIDGTWELLSSFAVRDDRIKLIRNERNLGLAVSLNKCLELSSGKYIARHDCDDYSDASRLKKQLEYMKQHSGVCVLGCQSYLFDENGVWGKDKFPEKVADRDFLFTSPYRHGAVMFRREALIKAGGYRVAKETYRTEDYDLFMTMQTFCKGENLNEYLYWFCENSSAKKRRKYRYRIDEAKVRFRGFKKLGLFPSAVPYVAKPLVVGLIPQSMLDKLKDRHYKRR